MKPFDRRAIKGTTVSSTLKDDQIGGNGNLSARSTASSFSSSSRGIRVGGPSPSPIKGSREEQSKLLQPTGVEDSIEDDEEIDIEDPVADLKK